MKRVGNLFDKFITFENLHLAARRACRGKKHKIASRANVFKRFLDGYFFNGFRLPNRIAVISAVSHVTICYAQISMACCESDFGYRVNKAHISPVNQVSPLAIELISALIAPEFKVNSPFGIR